MDFTALKNYMDTLVSERNVPGVDCIVYKEHEMIFRYFTGMSDIENKKEMRGNELYIIFSMTKMLTCTAALQLFEKGKYKLEDPLFKYMPEFSEMKISAIDFDTAESERIATGAALNIKAAYTDGGYVKNPITIKDLFTMGAGLDYNREAPAIKEALSQGRTSTQELVSTFSKTILGFEPGTRYRYSLCHDVLGALIEIWSGQKLSEYMEKNIFAPLEMRDTFFGVPKDSERLSRMATRYKYDENRKPERMPLECLFNLSDEYESGGAGLTSSATDYAIFLDALANGGIAKNGHRILSPETVELMGANHLKGEQVKDFDNLQAGYGYGLGVRTHVDKERSGSLSPVGEFGWDGAAGAFSMVDTKNKISLTYFQEIHNWERRIQSEMRNILYTCINADK